MSKADWRHSQPHCHHNASHQPVLLADLLIRVLGPQCLYTYYVPQLPMRYMYGTAHQTHATVQWILRDLLHMGIPKVNDQVSKALALDPCLASRALAGCSSNPSLVGGTADLQSPMVIKALWSRHLVPTLPASLWKGREQRSMSPFSGARGLTGSHAHPPSRKRILFHPR